MCCSNMNVTISPETKHATRVVCPVAVSGSLQFSGTCNFTRSSISSIIWPRTSENSSTWMIAKETRVHVRPARPVRPRSCRPCCPSTFVHVHAVRLGFVRPLPPSPSDRPRPSGPMKKRIAEMCSVRTCSYDS